MAFDSMLHAGTKVFQIKCVCLKTSFKNFSLLIRLRPTVCTVTPARFVFTLHTYKILRERELKTCSL